MTKDEKIKSLDGQLSKIEDRISCIENHATIESLYELSELNIQKGLLELERYDIENNTHKRQIVFLEKNLYRLTELLQNAIDNYNEVKLLGDFFEVSKARIKMQLIHLRVKKCKSEIESYERLDAKILENNKRRIL